MSPARFASKKPRRPITSFTTERRSARCCSCRDGGLHEIRSGPLLCKAMVPPSFPESAAILSGGKRFLLSNVTFTELGGGLWQVEFNVGMQENTMALIDIVRGGGGSLMLSIDGGPVIGAHTRMRPLYQTILSQPMRYEF